MSACRSGRHGWVALLYLPAVGGLSVMVLAMAYCWLNAAGHTALELRDGWVVFGPLMLIGVGLRVRGDRQAGRVTLVVGVLGMAFGYFVHHLGIMQEYNYWAKHGLEAKNPHAAWWLIAWGVLVAAALGVSFTGWRGRGARGGNESGARVVAM